jgi:hypothetical protein
MRGVILRRYLPRLSLETAEAPTESFLQAHWRQIEFVAGALLERKTLTGVDVAALVRPTR